MGSVRRSVALAAALLALAPAAVAQAQTPGDEQYVDPFGAGQQEGGGDEPAASDDEGSAGEPAPAQEPAPAAEPAPAPESSAQAPSGQEQLPYTGADEGLVALAGVILLAGGVALRLRLRA